MGAIFAPHVLCDGVGCFSRGLWDFVKDVVTRRGVEGFSGVVVFPSHLRG